MKHINSIKKLAALALATSVATGTLTSCATNDTKPTKVIIKESDQIENTDSTTTTFETTNTKATEASTEGSSETTTEVSAIESSETVSSATTEETTSAIVSEPVVTTRSNQGQSKTKYRTDKPIYSQYSKQEKKLII